MQYAILVYETDEDFAARADARSADYWGAHAAFRESLGSRGVGGAGLSPPHAATTVRKRGGAREVLDGPFADTKEQLGGFYLVEAPDLDAALKIAEQCPTRGAIEVRPVLAMPG